MVHLVTKKGIACAVGNSRTESTFEVTTRAKVCTCPQCQNTQVFKDTLTLENEARVEISLRKSQYDLLVKGLEWLVEDLDEDDPNREQIFDITQELEYQEKS